MKTESMLDVFQQNQYNLKNAARKSNAWFEQQVNLIKLQQVTPNSAFRSKSLDSESRVMPGHLYMFFYDAKNKDTLPYWDRFPLVFPFRKTKNGFYGLNMHYLPYQLRVVLLDRLMQFKNNDAMDETTKLKYSWDTINGMAKYAAAQPCVKQYLNSHVVTPFRRVDANNWATAMLLPVESFVGSNKSNVWQESKRIIRRS
jgi:hypothetical protein